MREVVILGVGMHRFGKHADKTHAQLGQVAALNALADAGVAWKEIQGAYCGSVYQGTASGHKVIAEIGLTGIPIVNVENACSSSTSAMRLGYQAVAAGIYDIVIALGFEKLGSGMIRSTAYDDWQRTQGHAVLMSIYAHEAQRHMEEYGTTKEQMAKVSVKNRRNACHNPFAHFHEPVTLEQVLGSRMVCDPLTLLQCAPTSDGASAAVLCAKDIARRYTGKPITIATTVLKSELYNSPTKPGLGIIERAAKEAYETAGIGPEDLDVVEGYDAASVGEFLSYEALGLCPQGEAGAMIDRGETEIGGRIPVSTSGGLLGRGHPLGATGLAQMAELVWQLRGEATGRQVEGVKVALAHSMGSGPNCCVTILKR